jgi:hypothetical protein
MRFKLKSFKKKAYFFTPEQLSDKEAFKAAVHKALELTWLNTSDGETPAEVVAKVQGWVAKIDAAIDELDEESLPIQESHLDVLWMESSDVWDDIDAGDYEGVDELFGGFVNSIINSNVHQDEDYDASSDAMSEKVPMGKDFPVASYDAETRTAKFKLHSYHTAPNGHIYRPESDEVGTFIVVTKPTSVSTALDVMFECNLGSLMLQSRGGLDPSDILRVFKRESAEAAKQFAEQVILQEMNRPDDDNVPSPIL